jgi:LPXTG-motif cell wall-anchored protein
LANLKLGVTVGTDEELLIVPIDLTNFIFKNALPELPVTGSDTDTPRSLAVVMVIGGLLLYAVRRRLLIKN